jgi:hypothetical protein
MSYDRQFLKIDWLFNVAGTTEVALTGLHVSSTAGWTGAAAALGELTTTAMGNVQARMAVLLANTNIKWASYSHLVGVKFAAVGADGHYLTDPRTVTDGTDVGDDSDVLPQASVVVSLRSGSVLGEANYGRMYLPHTTMALGSATPYTTSGIQSAFAAAAVTFITNVAADLNGVITPAVTPMIMSSKGSGVSKVPSEVLIGRVIDTQRRRRNKLTESYATGTL